MKKIQTEANNLQRDIESKALLDNNLSGLLAYKKKVVLLKEQEKKSQETKERLESLENDMSEIKQMLQILINKVK